MKVCVVGEGAFGNQHISALKQIAAVDEISLVGGQESSTEKTASEHGITRYHQNLKMELDREDVDAFILATPTPMHAQQAIDILNAGKHVLVEIPMADNYADAERLAKVASQSIKVSMVGHIRRYNPGHQWIKNEIENYHLSIQHLVVQTYFFRRENLNALGEKRTWIDHLLWHHACHTVDLFQYQTGERISSFEAIQGPSHPELGIAMDMTIIMKVPSGIMCTLILSFNNQGMLGSNFRYVCDRDTYTSYYDDLFDSNQNKIQVSEENQNKSGIQLMDEDFINAIQYNTKPKANLNDCLHVMKDLHLIEQKLHSG